jgi:hypothetical protein
MAVVPRENLVSENLSSYVNVNRIYAVQYTYRELATSPFNCSSLRDQSGVDKRWMTAVPSLQLKI